jgi:CheY-like chemotaxis protein
LRRFPATGTASKIPTPTCAAIVTTPVLICDDSSFARNQIARALPQDWDVALSFAGEGGEALAAIKAGRADVLFLDLNMPGLDGYGVLEAIRREDLPTLAIVISGDVQPEARERVMKLGALDFIKKPVGTEQITAILRKYGIHNPATTATRRVESGFDEFDSYKEIVNVAMGRAADLLARLLGAFVVMPIPRVTLLEGAELRMILEAAAAREDVSTVCQGFIGSGLAGEILVFFGNRGFADLAALMQPGRQPDEAGRLELLSDVASLVNGACLKGVAEQLDLYLNMSPPLVLGPHLRIADLVKRNAARWKRLLAVEMQCRVEQRAIVADLLLLFTEDSLAPLRHRAALLAG